MSLFQSFTAPTDYSSSGKGEIVALILGHNMAMKFDRQ